MRKILIIILICMVYNQAQAQQQLNGKVIGENRQPLQGAAVLLKSTGQTFQTDDQGRFSLPLTGKSTALNISFVGYHPQDTIIYGAERNKPLILALRSNEYVLEEVPVYNGYQAVRREKLTGSVTTVNNQLLNRRVGSNVLSRLEDVTSGLIFNRGVAANNNNNLSIRGQSTLFANTQPLIVVDNFPYEGDIGSINPNDVENVSVLKDAAAAAIWGARAGNGVIVITTKRGKVGKPKVAFNANYTLGNRPDQFYQPLMSTSDFIDLEKTLFARGTYAAYESAVDNRALTPVVELLIAARDGKLTTAVANAQIDALRNADARTDIDRYLYRKSSLEQYALNISGGSGSHQYYLSGGYDRNLANLNRNSQDRLSFAFNNSILLLNKKLRIETGLLYTVNDNRNNNPGHAAMLQTTATTSYYPYIQLADADGTPLAITKNYRNSFVNAAMSRGLLDWTYKPLEDLALANNQTKSTERRFNTGATYTILTGLKAGLLVQYGGSDTRATDLHPLSSYFTRDLINRFTIAGTTGALTYNIPTGGILDQDNINSSVWNYRAQISYNRDLSPDWSINAIAGHEKRRTSGSGTGIRFYGYDDAHAIASKVNYTAVFPQYNNATISQGIPFVDNAVGTEDTFISWYGSSAVSWKGRYDLSTSLRWDQSNIFGVNTNQKGIPLYSIGLGWTLSKETFYNSTAIPYLKLRASYGYNGNIDRSLSAFTTATYVSSNVSQLNTIYAIIQNPPNPDLRWERVQVVNFGVDFSMLKNKITGSVDLYRKKGIDLIGSTFFPPSSGIINFYGNGANTIGHGMDADLRVQWLSGPVQWSSQALLSSNLEKVTDYKVKASAASYVAAPGRPLTGKPLLGIYSYDWAGLDPQTGDPRGYLNGVPSNDYAGIIAAASPESLIYSGSAKPVTYGALRNDLLWKGISLSVNISYRLGYFFRRPVLNYNTLLNGFGYLVSYDYSERWQKPGDERITDVPSLPGVINNNRDLFYSSSVTTVEKGDHIRLQDISLGYTFNNTLTKKVFGAPVYLYAYANNLGIIWKASKSGWDPDYLSSYVPPRTYSLGVKIELNK